VGTACCLALLVDSMNASEHLDGTSPVALEILSDLGSGDAYDPCDVNTAQCGHLDECQ
ncbi:MAG: hypothetical protein JRI25_16725, partial [Deltaproteobacteria bacterium]|nr:hypothetical protein [Deltaproteobacteria bacterium]